MHSFCLVFVRIAIAESCCLLGTQSESNKGENNSVHEDVSKLNLESQKPIIHSSILCRSPKICSPDMSSPTIQDFLTAPWKDLK